MALLLRSSLHPTARRLGLFLAVGLPLCGYLATAAGHGYFLDAGEFVAAAVELGISHPPGQPLHALVASVFARLPLGPLSFRVALASAAMAAVACAALYLAIETTLRAQGLHRPWVLTPLAVGATWLCAGSEGFWFQAVRPEVYALQAALGFIVLERVIALEARWPTRDVRPIFTAALALGLALANHHFLAILLLPAIAPTAARVLRARGPAALWLAAGFGALGLIAYAYLPLRAAANPTPNLGAPSTLGRLFWVVSAQAFQKNVGAGVPEPAGDRVADVIVLLGTNLHVAVWLALAGLYAMLRTPGVRRLGAVWLAAWLLPLVARSWLGFSRENPDAEGYLLTSFGATAALSAALFGRVLTPIGGLDGSGTTRGAASKGAVALALAVAALGLAQLQHGATQVTLSQLTATDELDEYRRRRLPAGAIVLTHQPETIFGFWGAQAQDHLRPDVTLVPMPFLAYPAMIDILLERDPELTELLRSYLLVGELQQPMLQSLASRRPVLVELDPRVSPALYETLVPAGLYYQVLPGGTTDADERQGSQDQQAMYTTLYARLGAQLQERQVRKQLLWHHYVDALYYAAFGDVASAHRAIAQGRAIEPEETQLKAMEEALKAMERPGPLDVRPWIVGND